MTRIIAVTSGGSGAGKTSIAVNLAVQLARRGQRLCLLDAGGEGTATVSRLLKLNPQHTVEDLALSDIGFSDVVIRNCLGIDVLPGKDCMQGVNQLTAEQLQRLVGSLSQLDAYDVVLIDLAPVTDRRALAFALASPEIILTMTPEPDSRSDAYAGLKLLSARPYANRLLAVVNRCRNHTVGRHSYDKFREITEFYLGLSPPLLGMVGEDPGIQRLVQNQTSLLSKGAAAAVANDIGSLAKQLLSDTKAVPECDVKTFWTRYLQAADIAPVPERQDISAKTATDAKAPQDRDLREQIEMLSGQVDSLIAEIERLRTNGERDTRLVDLATDNSPLPDYADVESLLAGLATRAEQVHRHDGLIPIYHLERQNGDVLRVAYHSFDDDLVKPEPQTTSS